MFSLDLYEATACRVINLANSNVALVISLKVRRRGEDRLVLAALGLVSRRQAPKGRLPWAAQATRPLMEPLKRSESPAPSALRPRLSTQ